MEICRAPFFNFYLLKIIYKQKLKGYIIGKVHSNRFQIIDLYCEKNIDIRKALIRKAIFISISKKFNGVEIELPENNEWNNLLKRELFFKRKTDTSVYFLCKRKNINFKKIFLTNGDRDV